MSEKPNILVPMAGDGVRFKNAGYLDSKPMIPLFKGYPMISFVIDNILPKHNNPLQINLFCCVRKEDSDLKDLMERRYKAKVITVDKLTSGPAATCLLAKEYVDNDASLIIVNSDQYIGDFSINNFLLLGSNYDAVIGTFPSNSPKNSYVRLKDGLVIEVREKQVISEVATNGAHLWRHGKDFVQSAEQMIQDKALSINNEYYISETFNYLIKQGKKVVTYSFLDHWPLGTPEDLQLFQKKFGDKK